MKKAIYTTLLTLIGLTSIGNLNMVSAQTFLPDDIQQIFDLLGEGGSGAAAFVVSRVQLALFIALGVVVLVAVIYALLAAFKYIRSQGDPGEIEEAQKAIKAIFFGLAALLIAIVGIVLVFVFFGADRPEPILIQTCISAPNSVGCSSCQANTENSTCLFCEEVYAAVANGSLPDVNNDGALDEVDIAAVRRIGGITNNGRNCIDPLQGGN